MTNVCAGLRCLATSTPAEALVTTESLMNRAEGRFTQMLPPAFRVLTNWRVEKFYAQQMARKDLTKWTKLRAKGYRFLANPVSSRSASIFSVLVLLVSLTSVFCFGIEMTLEARKIEESYVDGAFNASVWNSIFKRSDTLYCLMQFILAFFLLELVASYVCYDRPWTHPMLWIDTICVVPLLIRESMDYVGSNESVLTLYATDRPLGVVLVLLASTTSFRLLKMTRHLLGYKVLIKTIKHSLTAMIVPCYLLILLLTFFGTLIYAVEYEPNDAGDSTKVPDVSTAWWMLLTTMTTVGYGDYSPQTVVGRILTGIAMIAGVMVVSMPIAIVGSTFASAWSARTLTLLGERLRLRVHLEDTLVEDDSQSMGVLPVEVSSRSFSYFDPEGKGSFDYKTFKMVVLSLGLHVSNER